MIQEETMVNRKRPLLTMTVPQEIIDYFDKAAKELGMTRSRFFEFLVTSMMKSETASFGTFIEDVLKTVLRKKK